MRNIKGITLIALVITIIVLLILVGVSISAVIGENGIATKAKVSKEETRAASIEEVRDLWKAENQFSEELDNDESIKTLEDVLDELERQKLITSDERGIIEETGEITIGKRLIIFEEKNYTISGIDKFYLYDKDGNVMPILEEYNPTMQLEGDDVVYTLEDGVWINYTGYMGAAYGSELYKKITNESIINIELTVNGKVVKYTGPIERLPG